jgi:hypothetical protein
MQLALISLVFCVPLFILERQISAQLRTQENTSDDQD